MGAVFADSAEAVTVLEGVLDRFLASEDAKNITGQILYVDGGQTFL